MFARGLPMAYYVGLLAGKNALDLRESTKEGRNINRHYYSLDEIAGEVERPVVKELLRLMELRNSHPAFDVEGELEVTCGEGGAFTVRRTSGDAWAKLDANLKDHTYRITHS
jgi:sucrose phosphorylase